ncbi:MAG: hypothetical protein AAF802_02830 [Planctomycetota bacterium]
MNDQHSGGSEPVRKAWILFALMTILIGAPVATAQAPQSAEEYGRPETHSKPSVFARLDAFQQDVRLRMKRALGLKSKPAPETTSPMNGSAEYQFDRESEQQDFNVVRPVRVSASEDWYRNRSNQATHQEYYDRVDYAHPMSPQERSAIGQQRQSYPEPYDAGIVPVQASEPLPPPIRNIPTEVLSRADRSNVPMNTGPQMPVANGAYLGQSPVTATEHALRLIEENGDLKAKLAASDAVAERLREKLTETQELLAQSSQAVQEARDEIDYLVDSNRKLQNDLEASETKYNRYLAETDRMLQAIREELDDVLVREISSNRNP